MDDGVIVNVWVGSGSSEIISLVYIVGDSFVLYVFFLLCFDLIVFRICFIIVMFKC